MKSCPYCGQAKAVHRKTCYQQSCIDEEVREFSLSYPVDKDLIFPEHLECNFGRHTAGTYKRIRHEVQ